MNIQIKNLDFTNVKMKLMDPDEGQGWSRSQCDIVEQEYKRYLQLLIVYGNAVPTRAMDIFWHQHILDTRAYLEDCNNVFGEYLHHYPYFGMFGEVDHQNLIDSFELTKKRYKETFNEELDRMNGLPNDYNKCHTCKGSCSHCNRPL